ncbi:MAG: transcription termination/antitermination factor NusG [Ruminococcaceae bacterium]|nr:transcription termination/antitermination factor NusG [Oscillospiraceae bacterium]
MTNNDIEESSSASDAAGWYVIHTYSGYENKVKASLERMIDNLGLHDYFFDIIIPMLEEVEIKDGKEKSALKKLFPGYVLVKMIYSNETWHVVKSVRGVTGFVGTGSVPTPLTEQEIRALGVDFVETVVDYEPGDAVDVISGPLESFSGVVESVNVEKGCVKVLVSMFGRQISAELEYSQIQKVL